jgi:signal transduction histidine kinase
MSQETTVPRPPASATALPELNLPFSLEQARLEAEKCILCNNPVCTEACPEHKDIPGCLKAIMESLDLLSDTLRTKMDFLNTLSHDLRTPLNVVIGNIGLIEDGFCGHLTPEMNKAVQVIKRNAQDLLMMLNQVLNLSRLEAGAVLLRIEEFSLTGLVSKLRANFSAPAQLRGLEFKWEVKEDCSVRGDPHKVEEILNNLLTNAVKYTDRGVVTLSAGLESGGERIWFEVADTGEGIPQEDLPYIFEPFRRSGPPSAHRQGGVGLGLAIVKRLLDLLGGRIEVESKLNEGSRFRVVLPRVCTQQKNKAEGVNMSKGG